jgi:hypothetical protein
MRRPGSRKQYQLYFPKITKEEKNAKAAEHSAKKLKEKGLKAFMENLKNKPKNDAATEETAPPTTERKNSKVEPINDIPTISPEDITEIDDILGFTLEE